MTFEPSHDENALMRDQGILRNSFVLRLGKASPAATGCELQPSEGPVGPTYPRLVVVVIILLEEDPLTVGLLPSGLGRCIDGGNIIPTGRSVDEVAPHDGVLKCVHGILLSRDFGHH